jgi:type IV secretory pathway TrbD component
LGSRSLWVVGKAMEGFSVPVHRSLTQPILLGGAPREFAILNGTLAAALLFGLHSLLGLPICLVLHAGAVALAKQDPQFLDTFKRHINHKPYYAV